MKKTVTFFLTLLILLLPLQPAFARTQPPTVFVAGYTSSNLWLDRGTENQKRVWRVHVGDEIVNAVKAEIPKLIGTGAVAAAGVYEPLFKVLEPYVEPILEPLRADGDGNSVYDLEVWPHAVKDTRVDRMKALGFNPDHDHIKTLGRYVGDKNTYVCTLDWRMGQIDNAAVLNDYINGVLEETGADKINLFGVSYGGQVCASYLSIYGGSKVVRAVLHCPALNGSSIVPALLSGEMIGVDWSELLRMYDAYEANEKSYDMLTDVVFTDGLDPFMRAFAQRFMIDFFKNFGSVWDLVPLERYEELRDKLLSDGTHAGLIEKSDRYHFEIAAKRAEIFDRLQKEGTDIAIVAGSGHSLAVDKKGISHDSDVVIDLASTTGAKKTGDTYDLSGAYLPDRTWIVRDMMHALGVTESKVEKLMMTLLTTDDIESVLSSPEYPQVLTSRHRNEAVFCEFSSCAEGYATKYSTRLNVYDLSETDTVYIDNIVCEGAGLRFSWDVSQALAPGECLTADVTGKVPANDKTFRVKVYYVKKGEKYALAKCREQVFEFDAGGRYPDILTFEPDSGSPVITEGAAKRSGILSAEVFFARVGWIIWRVLAFFGGGLPAKAA